MEAVDERDGSFLCDFGLDVLADRGRAEHAQALALATAELVRLDCGNEQVVLLVDGACGHWIMYY